nr:MAG TPA: hypothetical protein [Caudoviricetes sp.]
MTDILSSPSFFLISRDITSLFHRGSSLILSDMQSKET